MGEFRQLPRRVDKSFEVRADPVQRVCGTGRRLISVMPREPDHRRARESMIGPDLGTGFTDMPVMRDPVILERPDGELCVALDRALAAPLVLGNRQTGHAADEEKAARL